MGLGTVKVTANKVKSREKTFKKLRIILLIILLFLFLLFLALSLIYSGGNFTIIIDQELTDEKGIVLYNSKDDKNFQRRLYAEEVESMDNISINWLPQDIHETSEGAHNGDNYIAYTFYIENQGDEEVNYWYEINIDDVIKNVDEAVRIMIYFNGEQKVYAKENIDTKEAEPNTIPFVSEEKALVEPREEFKPGDIDKFTVVIWLEGDDPDCIDEIIGGSIKMHMNFIQEDIGDSDE